MAHTNIDENHPDFTQAVEYVNTKLAGFDPISKEQWDGLITILLKSFSNGIVGDQMKQRAYAVRSYFGFKSSLDIDKLSDELCSDFSLFLSSEHSVMESQLNEFCSETELPGNKFMQWLLDNCSEKIANEYIKENENQPQIILVDFDDRGRSPKSNADEDELAQDSDDEDDSTPDSDDEDDSAQDSDDKDEYSQESNIEKKYGLLDSKDMTSPEDEPVPERIMFAQVVRQGKNNAIQLALISITTQMSEQRNWRKKDYFIYAGVQMYPYLQDKNIELTTEEFDLCRQLKDFVEDSVFKKHQSQRDFNAAVYLADQHELAGVRIAERKTKLNAEYPPKPQDFSYDQLNRNRRMVELITDELLAPINSEQLAEICRLEKSTATKYLCEYKDRFLGESYSMIEDKLRRNKKYANIKLSKRSRDSGTAGE